MLHIILGILKVIGIILGILLLVLLAAFLAVVFVPLRYRITAEKKPQEEAEGWLPGSKVRAEAKVSWLLHIFCVKAAVTPGGGLDIDVRLLGFRLPLFQRKQTTQPDDAGSISDGEIFHQETETPEKPDGEILHQETETPEEPDGAILRQETETAEEPAGEILHQETGIPLEEGPQKGRSWDEAGEGAEKADGTSTDEKENKIRFIIKNICDRIKKILRMAWAFLTGLTEIPERLSRIWDKAAGILHRPQEILELAKKLEAQALLGDGLGYLQYLLRHYKPRRITGYLRIGTDDPAMSAQLTGLIYLFLPARADQFTIDTEFNDFVFETEMICSGHIRVCHGIRVLWQAFRNKKLRRVIRYLRNKK